jgi:SAM-dependent methyltransferase
MISVHDQKDIFDEMADGHHSYVYTPDSIDKIDRLIPADGRVLNIGCGTGQILEYLGRVEWYGIDISPKSIAIAKRFFKEAKVGDITQRFDYPDGFFDIVLSINTLHHVAGRLSSVFGEVGRVLRPGGTFYAIEPDADNLKTLLTHHPRSPVRVVPCRDERALHTKDIAALAAYAGFSVEFSPITLSGDQMGHRAPLFVRLLKAPFVIILELLYRKKAESFLLTARKKSYPGS